VAVKGKKDPVSMPTEIRIWQMI